MQERDAIAAIILFVFLVWVIAIIIGLRIVNKWAQKIADARAAMDAEHAEVATTVTVEETEAD
ncbi:hypothetical protein L207DRAFT_582830 [Hyaloscypha variabilis F]|uniref:Uncharacterized protein n=1 Tax=Hyaloscypha variabilis (strain UAMH 11265 / GT02V1 / F) TaxID=1149755 RepID=A0A2J6RQ58_HYAVF|nr:hypothetical protein L207DRAFT_582830 [Hyaloscypha variabilis F]